jgi:hypothetical protein
MLSGLKVELPQIWPTALFSKDCSALFTFILIRRLKCLVSAYAKNIAHYD